MDLIDFRVDQGLNSLREAMGAELREWSVWDWKKKGKESILDRLSTQRGIELKDGLDDLEVTDDGTFQYKGEKVLLYIRDQYYSEDPNREYKYHICSCRTIQKMFDEGRKNRYVVTRDTSEEFYVCKMNGGEVVEEGTERMRVCKSCLQELSYKGYGRHGSPKSKRIYGEFSLGVFFDLEGRTRFDEKPDHTARSAPRNEYPDDFEEVSRRYRKKQGWTCEECGRDLSEDKQWLHTHHINSQKGDNRDANLKALCLKCHSEEHHHMSNSDYIEFMQKYGGD
jgi:hypothetical protein